MDARLTAGLLVDSLISRLLGCLLLFFAVLLGLVLTVALVFVGGSWLVFKCWCVSISPDFWAKPLLNVSDIIALWYLIYKFKLSLGPPSSPPSDKTCWLGCWSLICLFAAIMLPVRFPGCLIIFHQLDGVVVLGRFFWPFDVTAFIFSARSTRGVTI